MNFVISIDGHDIERRSNPDGNLYCGRCPCCGEHTVIEAPPADTDLVCPWCGPIGRVYPRAKLTSKGVVPA